MKGDSNGFNYSYPSYIFSAERVSITSGGGGKSIMYGCQPNLITPDKQLKAILEFICSEFHKLINCGIYYARQLYFNASKIIGKFDLEKEYKSNKHYQVLYFQAAQQILRSVAESFKSFKELNKKYRISQRSFQFN